MFLQAYEKRGRAKYYLNDYAGAIKDYNKALKINQRSNLFTAYSLIKLTVSSIPRTDVLIQR